MEIINDVNSDGYSFDDTFAGIPDGVTVHIPDSLSDGDKATVEAKLHSFGLPDSAVFDYYSWRG